MKLPIPSEMCPVRFIPDIYSVKANDLQHGKLLICKMIDIFDIKAAVFVKHINTAAAFISPNTILDHTSKENLMKNRSPASAKNTALAGDLFVITMAIRISIRFQSTLQI